MKRLTLLIPFLAIFSFCNAQTTLPEIPVKTSDGKEIKLSDLKTLGKPVVICFWATWCNPCMEELEAIADSFESWKKDVDFEFIAVSTDDSRSAGKVRSLVSGKAWPFKVVLDQNQDIMKMMNVSMIPFCFVVDKKGIAVYRHSGYVPGDEMTIFKEIKKVANNE